MIFGIVFIAALAALLLALVISPEHKVDGAFGIAVFYMLFGCGLVLAIEAL